jgi:CDP-paratose 2-epimerase
MRILVTGGGGFIGFNIVKFYAEQGCDVIVMDSLERSTLLGHSSDVHPGRFKLNLEKAKAYRNVQIVQYPNVSHRDNWHTLLKDYGEVDVIFHMAAQCGVPTSIADPYRDFQINAAGTVYMLEYARQCGAKVIYASSNKVYPIHDGWELGAKGSRYIWESPLRRKHGFPERDMPLSGSRTPYGASKYSGEHYCEEFCHAYGVQVGIFRMSCIYGPHQLGFEEQGWAAWFAIANRKGYPINIFGDGKQVRDMLWVEDLIKLYDKFVDADIDFGVFNAGGGPDNSVTLHEWMKLIEAHTGEAFKDVSYHDWRPSDQKIYTSDIDKARHAFNWEPTVSPLQAVAPLMKWVEEDERFF